jgi:uncharacterized membrane protein YfcA
MTLPPSQLLLGALAALLVGFSKTGVPGLGILIVPLMAIVFPAKLSVGALLPMLIVGDVLAVKLYRRHAQWSKLGPLFPWVLAGCIPGAWALWAVGDKQFQPALGWLVIGMIALDLVRRWLRWDRVPHHWAFVGFMGLATGFATTIGNVAGPLMAIYLLAHGLNKNEFLGTGAWYYLIVNCAKIPIFAGVGIITADTLQFDLLAVPAILVGAAVGWFTQSRLPQRVFNAAVLILAAIAALRLVVP